MNLDPVRPGSALDTDPHLRSVIAERVRQSSENGKRKGESWNQAPDIWTVLAAYPWVRLPYRFGYWKPDYSWWAGLITLGLWYNYHWVRGDRTFQFLDRQTNQPIGEFFKLPNAQLDMPRGEVLFAGDVNSIGVVWQVGADPEHIDLGFSIGRGSNRMRQKVEAVRAGAPYLEPVKQVVTFRNDDQYRVWYAESPEMPTKKAIEPINANSYPSQGLD